MRQEALTGFCVWGVFLSFKVVTTLPYGFSAALIAIADAITPPIARKLRLPVSGCPFSGLFLMLSSFKIVFGRSV